MSNTSFLYVRHPAWIVGIIAGAAALLVAVLAGPSAQAAEPIEPELTCLIPAGDGVIFARFGYDNPNNEPLSITAGSSDNFIAFMAGQELDQGQPDDFEPGRHENVFQVGFFNQVTWHLTGNTLEVSSEDLEEFACDAEPATVAKSGPGEADLGDSFSYEITVETGEFVGALLLEDHVPDVFEVEDVNVEGNLICDGETLEQLGGFPESGGPNHIVCGAFIESFHVEATVTVDVSVTTDECGPITNTAELSGIHEMDFQLNDADPEFEPLDSASVTTDLPACPEDAPEEEEAEEEAEEEEQVVPTRVDTGAGGTTGSQHSVATAAVLMTLLAVSAAMITRRVSR